VGNVQFSTILLIRFFSHSEVLQPEPLQKIHPYIYTALRANFHFTGTFYA